MRPTLTAVRTKLKNATRFLSRDKELEAVDALTDAWRLSRDPALAAVIDGWVTHLARSPIGEATASKQKAWLDRAKEKHTADLVVLFESLPRTIVPNIRHRLDALATWKANPVLARLLSAWREEQPFKVPYGKKLILALFEAQEDPRYGDWKVLVPLTEGDLAALQPPPAAAVDSGDIDALYRAVYAAPGDATRKQVLADALMEKGDGRGELIALQLAREQDDGKVSKREKELLAKYSVAALGRLSAVTRSQQLRSGFAHHVVVRGGAAFVEGAETCEEWATVESVDCRTLHSDLQTRLLSSPTLRSLKRAIWVTPEAVKAACDARGPLALEHVALTMGDDGSIAPELLDDCPLPALRSLEIVGPFRDMDPADAQTFLTSGLGLRLKFFSFCIGEEEAVPGLLQSALAGPLDRLDIRAAGDDWVLDLVAKTLKGPKANPLQLAGITRV